MTRLRGRTALVTGAGGFVGPYVAARLMEHGVSVHGLGSEPPRTATRLAEWHLADLRDPDATRAVVRSVQPDFVVHLAGQSSAARSFAEPVETFRANALGTWYLLDAVRWESPRARVLVVGTGEVYGSQREGTRANESTPFQPVSPYALSKAVADAMAAQAATKHGLDVVRTRSFGHTGPGQEPRFVIPSMAQQIVAIERGEDDPVLRVGNLDVTRDLCDVRDVARAYVLLLERGQAGRAYNVCRGVGSRLSDVVADLVARARVPIRIEVDPARMRPADVPYLVGDPATLQRETGWNAEIQLERTLDDVLKEWREKSAQIA